MQAPSGFIRKSVVATLTVGLLLVLAGAAFAVSGAAFTTVNEAADGGGNCQNGNPGVNCNIYTGKEFVWLNGGPAANGLGPDGQYFFAVLVPGGQPNPNDGGAKNLSDDFDAYTNRTFTVANGEVGAYAGTHDFDSGAAGAPALDDQPPFIRLFPYADTTNPGGVYILAICSLQDGYPVDPRDCKYDAFKVRRGAAKVQTFLSGRKYEDDNINGQLDAGENGLAGWQIRIQCTDGANAIVTTDANGEWSYATPLRFPTSGSTTCTVTEIQQPDWLQTGNTVDQSSASGGASVTLNGDKSYTIVFPNNAPSTADGLYFGNKCRFDIGP
ncbi:MAG: hypothetical protein ACT4QE_20175 [Anaerolineales bacterium]